MRLHDGCTVLAIMYTNFSAGHTRGIALFHVSYELRSEQVFPYFLFFSRIGRHTGSLRRGNLCEVADHPQESSHLLRQPSSCEDSSVSLALGYRLNLISRLFLLVRMLRALPSTVPGPRRGTWVRQ